MEISEYLTDIDDEERSKLWISEFISNPSDKSFLASYIYMSSFIHKRSIYYAITNRIKGFLQSGAEVEYSEEHMGNESDEKYNLSIVLSNCVRIYSKHINSRTIRKFAHIRNKLAHEPKFEKFLIVDGGFLDYDAKTINVISEFIFKSDIVSRYFGVLKKFINNSIDEDKKKVESRLSSSIGDKIPKDWNSQQDKPKENKQSNKSGLSDELPQIEPW